MPQCSQQHSSQESKSGNAPKALVCWMDEPTGHGQTVGYDVAVNMGEAPAHTATRTKPEDALLLLRDAADISGHTAHGPACRKCHRQGHGGDAARLVFSPQAQGQKTPAPLPGGRESKPATGRTGAAAACGTQAPAGGGPAAGGHARASEARRPTSFRMRRTPFPRPVQNAELQTAS